jgi:hypothetical protein
MSIKPGTRFLAQVTALFMLLAVIPSFALPAGADGDRTGIRPADYGSGWDYHWNGNTFEIWDIDRMLYSEGCQVSDLYGIKIILASEDFDNSSGELWFNDDGEDLGIPARHFDFDKGGELFDVHIDSEGYGHIYFYNGGPIYEGLYVHFDLSIRRKIGDFDVVAIILIGDRGEELFEYWFGGSGDFCGCGDDIGCWDCNSCWDCCHCGSMALILSKFVFNINRLLENIGAAFVDEDRAYGEYEGWFGDVDGGGLNYILGEIKQYWAQDWAVLEDDADEFVWEARGHGIKSVITYDKKALSFHVHVWLDGGSSGGLFVNDNPEPFDLDTLQDEISELFADGEDAVTVTGEYFASYNNLWLYIPDGKRVVWEAEMSGRGYRLIILGGEGTFEVTDGGKLELLDRGHALYSHPHGFNGTVLISGGMVISNDGIAIHISGSDVEITSGMVASFSGGRAIFANDGDITLSGGVVFAFRDEWEDVTRGDLAVENDAIIIAWDYWEWNGEGGNPNGYLDWNNEDALVRCGVDRNILKVEYSFDNWETWEGFEVPLPTNPVDALIDALEDYGFDVGFDEDEDIVTVTGEIPDADDSLEINIPGRLTVVWEATLTSEDNFSDRLISINGNGTFVVAEDGLISTSGDGNRAIWAGSIYIIIDGGEVSAAGYHSVAVRTHGHLTMESGTVSASGDYSAAICTHYGNVILNGGTVTAAGYESWAVRMDGGAYVNNGAAVTGRVPPEYWYNPWTGVVKGGADGLAVKDGIATISTASELAFFASLLGYWNTGGCCCDEGWVSTPEKLGGITTVVLKEDINLSGGIWFPVNMSMIAINGTGKTISGLNVQDYTRLRGDWSSGYAGLFGILDRCIVRDLKFESPVIEIGEHWEIYMGVIAGRSVGSRFNDVYIEDPSVTLANVNVTAFIGGVAGYTEDSCEPNLIGRHISSINGAEVHGGTIAVTNGFWHSYGHDDWLGSAAYIGGIAGANFNGVIINAAVYGTEIKANHEHGSSMNAGLLCMGGIAGYTSLHEPPQPGTCIFNSVSTAVLDITGGLSAEYEYAGGIAGWVNEDVVVNNVYIGEKEVFGHVTNEQGHFIGFNEKYYTVAEAVEDKIVGRLNDETINAGGRWFAIRELHGHIGDEDYMNISTARARFKSWVYLEEVPGIIEANTPGLTHRYGDVDGDGFINSADVTLLRRYVATALEDRAAFVANNAFNLANAHISGKYGPDGLPFIAGEDITKLREYLRTLR